MNWFDDSDAQEKVLDFLSESLPELLGHDDHQLRETTSFLDLGTGNGALLFGLRDEGWTGTLMGVDYSERSVEFAKRIGVRRREEQRQQQTPENAVEEGRAQAEGEVEKEVQFQLHDILSDTPSSLLKAGQKEGWDVVLDKGTFDAISLSSDLDARGRRVVEGYRAQMMPLIREGGLFLVTSCNWTEAELDAWFATDDRQDGMEDFVLENVGRVQYRSFSFGGVKGQTISTLCFRKRRAPSR
jgi:EEF1A lysine methyltransferase 2